MGVEGQSCSVAKHWLYRIVGISISVLLIYLLIRRVDVTESIRTLGSANPGTLAVAATVYLCGFPVRALRWRGILRGQKEITLREISVPVLVGHAANIVLPARTGEIYRAHLLGRHANTSRSGAMGSIVVERTFDGLMLLCLILAVLLVFPRTQFLGGAALATGGVFLALAVGILFYSLAVDKTHRTLNWMFGLLPGRVRHLAGQRAGAFLKGVRGVSTAQGYLKTGAYTVVIWTIEATAIALVVISFGVMVPVSGYLLVFTLAALGTTLPSAPGHIGPYQYAFVLALGYFSVSQETALAVSIAAQFALIGSITVIGGLLFYREQLRPTTAQDRAYETESEESMIHNQGGGR